MAKQEQVLTLEPAGELRFRGPFTDVVTAELKLSNPTEKRVCFKVKTTAPKRYCVRPNSGILEPSATISVAVMLQPFDYDPTEKNKHKFMVQTMFAPDGASDNAENLWKDVSPENLMDTRLRCVFEMPDQNNMDSITNAELSKSSPDKAMPAKVQGRNIPQSNIEAELRKSLDEIRKLQSEVTDVRTENSRLKEEGLRLRKIAVQDTVKSAPTTHTAVIEQQGSSLPPILFLVIAVIVGLLIGKLIL